MISRWLYLKRALHCHELRLFHRRPSLLRLQISPKDAIYSPGKNADPHEPIWILEEALQTSPVPRVQNLRATIKGRVSITVSSVTRESDLEDLL